MKRVRVADVPSIRHPPAAIQRDLTDALGTTDVAINHYELDHGESFAYAYHAHEIQEEVFYVESGTVTFETEAGPVEVGAGEMVRFGPGEFQRGINEGPDRVIALALGAPLEYGEVEKYRDCPTCGERTAHTLRRTDDAKVAVCDRCGTETGRW